MTQRHPNLFRVPLLALAIAIGCLSPIAMAVPSSENAALRYWRVIQILGEDQLSMVSNADFKVFQPQQNIADEGEDPVTTDEFLASNADTIELLIEATRFPGCDFGIDYEKGIDALLPNLGPMRRMAQILILDANRLLAEGDTDGAAERIAACLRLSQHITGDTTLINSLVSIAVFALVEDMVLKNQPSFSAENRQTIATALARFDAEDPFGCVKSVLGEAKHFGDWMVRRVDNEWSTPETFKADIAMLYGEDPQDGALDDLVAADHKDLQAFRRSLLSQIEQYCTVLRLTAEAWNSPDAEQSLKALEAKIVDGTFGGVAMMMAPSLIRCHHSDMKTRAKLDALKDWASAH